jgi:hypothetical protein
MRCYQPEEAGAIGGCEVWQFVLHALPCPQLIYYVFLAMKYNAVGSGELSRTMTLTERQRADRKAHDPKVCGFEHFREELMHGIIQKANGIDFCDTGDLLFNRSDYLSDSL